MILTTGSGRELSRLRVSAPKKLLDSRDELPGDTRQRASQHEPCRVYPESQQQERACNSQADRQPIHNCRALGQFENNPQNVPMMEMTAWP